MSWRRLSVLWIILLSTSMHETAAQIPCKVPRFGNVQCDAIGTVQCHEPSTIGILDLTGNSQSVTVFENANYCRCKPGFTGLTCNQTCPTAVKPPLSYFSRINENDRIVCSNRHIQLQYIPEESCGQLFRHEPKCTCPSEAARKQHRQHWIESAVAWALPGFCSCPKGYLGNACEWKDATRTGLTWQDVLENNGKFVQNKNKFVIYPIASLYDNNNERQFVFLLFLIVLLTLLCDCMIQLKRLDICGSKGSIAIRPDGQIGCKCYEGYRALETRRPPVSSPGINGGFEAPDDSAQLWTFSQVPICAISTKGDVLDVDMNGDGEKPPPEPRTPDPKPSNSPTGTPPPTTTSNERSAMVACLREALASGRVANETIKTSIKACLSGDVSPVIWEMCKQLGFTIDCKPGSAPRTGNNNINKSSNQQDEETIHRKLNDEVHVEADPLPVAIWVPIVIIIVIGLIVLIATLVKKIRGVHFYKPVATNSAKKSYWF